MKKMFVILLAVLMIGVLAGCGGAEQNNSTEGGGSESSLPEGSSSSDVFADQINYYMPDDQNYMFSPLSIQMALAMVANGAAGETQTEILNAMGVENLEEYNNYIKALMAKYNNAARIELNLANSVWLNQDNASGDFTDSYKGLLNDYYGATANVTDNANAVNDINSWVSDKTKGKIPTLINDNQFTAYLVNAIYFYGMWDEEFDPQLTKEDDFTDRSGKVQKVDFMNQLTAANYGEVDGVRMLELPYIWDYSAEVNEQGYTPLETGVCMYILLADDLDYNAAQVLKKADDKNKLKNQEVNIYLPKFEIEYETGLNDILGRMGIEKAFIDGMADFSKMYEGNLFISDSIHKTYISVDEQGTEAAAATGMAAVESAFEEPAEPVEFRADHPFTFIIYDKANKEILFMGEYNYVK